MNRNLIDTIQLYSPPRVSQTVAPFRIYEAGRKVRAPQGRVPGNAWAA